MFFFSPPLSLFLPSLSLESVCERVAMNTVGYCLEVFFQQIIFFLFP